MKPYDVSHMPSVVFQLDSITTNAHSTKTTIELVIRLRCCNKQFQFYRRIQLLITNSDLNKTSQNFSGLLTVPRLVRIGSEEPTVQTLI